MDLERDKSKIDNLDTLTFMNENFIRSILEVKFLTKSWSILKQR
jgi:hypothetical protein